MINFYNFTLNATFITKVVFILIALVFILFGFLLARQVELLNQFLKLPLGGWVRIATLLYLASTLTILILVWVIL